ncbi:MAG: signal recognition particle-docking protein FtsY [Acidimicrobiaceae bacterium]|nr:signal recognition particle-docking protein FtsY [Ilumatobacter sp.]MCB9382177.1 signal recognition particle-docking protein FtsY [Acidimicrobiaceae bacterium]MCO5329527.1 signal recognition particle-docking protein FtsY [Ilumatobacteraceae bacterium]
MEWILLVLAAAVLVFGIGVVLWNRRRSAGQVGAPAATPLPARPAPAVRPAPDVEAEPEPAAEAPDLEAEPEPAAPAAPAAERPTFRSRMSKARSALAGAFLGIRGRRGITDETWDDLEEALLRADVGVRVTDELLGGLKARVKAKEITEPDALLDALQAEMTSRLAGADRTLHFQPGEPDSPNVWLFVGVNGVGKTTTIGKVAHRQRGEGRSVLLAAGDTFRAAAAEQLTTWAERSGAELVRGSEGGDPSAVIFDGIERASARGIDLVLGDTAGRLHTKTNLMDELRKVRRVAAKGKGRVTEVLLVIDATTGQNGLTQAREFGAATTVDGEGGVTGVVLTKLDGSAKGGIVFAIETELGLPVKLVGLGETIEDLVVFDPADFVDALFATD